MQFSSSKRAMKILSVLTVWNEGDLESLSFLPSVPPTSPCNLYHSCVNAVKKSHSSQLDLCLVYQPISSAFTSDGFQWNSTFCKFATQLGRSNSIFTHKYTEDRGAELRWSAEKYMFWEERFYLNHLSEFKARLKLHLCLKHLLIPKQHLTLIPKHLGWESCIMFCHLAQFVYCVVVVGGPG